MYRGLVGPILEYGISGVLDPQGVVPQQEIEKVQNRAAWFVTRNYCFETGSMTGILEKLKCESLKKRRRDSRLILLYKSLKGAASNPTDDLIPQIRHSRNHYSFPLQELPFTRLILPSDNQRLESQLPLLNVQRMVWLGLPIWWELSTNFPYHRSWWINVIIRWLSPVKILILFWYTVSSGHLLSIDTLTLVLLNPDMLLQTVFVCLLVLRFYSPVNPIAMGSCRVRSVYLTTLLLGRLSPETDNCLLESVEGREWP